MIIKGSDEYACLALHWYIFYNTTTTLLPWIDFIYSLFKMEFKERIDKCAIRVYNRRNILNNFFPWIYFLQSFISYSYSGQQHFSQVVNAHVFTILNNNYFNIRPVKVKSFLGTIALLMYNILLHYIKISVILYRLAQK